MPVLFPPDIVIPTKAGIHSNARSMDSRFRGDNEEGGEGGFTLVEMAIVLVILGLLIGGVLSGRTLIRAAELRSVTTEYNQHVAAVTAFKDRYMQLPGDMNNAIAFWDAAHTTPATCRNTVGTGTQTCNGDGNGQILQTATSFERHRFWQHLANAGLIEGQYTGVAGPGGSDDHVAGINVPTPKVSGKSGWVANFAGVQSGNASNFEGNYGNVLALLGAVANVTGDRVILTPEEAWSIDSKIDDGRPATGNFRQFKNAVTPGCVTTDVQATAEYNLTNTNLACSVRFLQAF